LPDFIEKKTCISLREGLEREKPRDGRSPKKRPPAQVKRRKKKNLYLDELKKENFLSRKRRSGAALDGAGRGEGSVWGGRGRIIKLQGEGKDQIPYKGGEKKTGKIQVLQKELLAGRKNAIDPGTPSEEGKGLEAELEHLGKEKRSK